MRCGSGAACRTQLQVVPVRQDRETGTPFTGAQDGEPLRCRRNKRFTIGCLGGVSIGSISASLRFLRALGIAMPLSNSRIQVVPSLSLRGRNLKIGAAWLEQDVFFSRFFRARRAENGRVVSGPSSGNPLNFCAGSEPHDECDAAALSQA